MEHMCADFLEECEALDGLLSNIDVGSWDRATPADGWSIRDQISHLWFFDQRARLAIVDVEAFRDDMTTLLARGVDVSIERGRLMRPPELLKAWRADRMQLADAARSIEPTTRVPWYGPSMSPRSFITARLMETWAHGQDIADALGATRTPTNRLRHIAHIGVRARPFSYTVNGRQMPKADVLVELTSPDGDTWSWGSSDCDVVRGSALDFCLLVTQRRHLHDTELYVDGEAANEWMGIAQAFAGPPGSGRTPGQFPRD
jgi:uncharacterized protein (TIGR03084 family)